MAISFEMFINNKYKKWYDCLIATRKSLVRSKTHECYYEQHHILPRCMGGTNRKDNLVLLTAREHFIAHVLLTYCVERQYVYKLTNAVRRFKRKALNSKHYETLRRTLSRRSKGELNHSYGKRWHHNPKTNEIVFCLLEDVPNGFIVGLPHQRGGRNNPKEFIWINNKHTEQLFHKNDVIPNGWRVGRCTQRSPSHMANMTCKRHTKERDEHHKRVMSDRVTMEDGDGNRKRVPITSICDFQNRGFKLTECCSINGTTYVSYLQASKEIQMSVGAIKNRVLSTREKWKHWKLLPQ